jgi:hypothetical protein
MWTAPLERARVASGCELCPYPWRGAEPAKSRHGAAITTRSGPDGRRRGCPGVRAIPVARSRRRRPQFSALLPVRSASRIARAAVRRSAPGQPTPAAGVSRAPRPGVALSSTALRPRSAPRAESVRDRQWVASLKVRSSPLTPAPSSRARSPRTVPAVPGGQSASSCSSVIFGLRAVCRDLRLAAFLNVRHPLLRVDGHRLVVGAVRRAARRLALARPALPLGLHAGFSAQPGLCSSRWSPSRHTAEFVQEDASNRGRGRVISLLHPPDLAASVRAPLSFDDEHVWGREQRPAWRGFRDYSFAPATGFRAARHTPSRSVEHVRHERRPAVNAASRIELGIYSQVVTTRSAPCFAGERQRPRPACRHARALPNPQGRVRLYGVEVPRRSAPPNGRLSRSA